MYIDIPIYSSDIIGTILLYGTDYEIIDNIGKQSPDIALGTNDDIGGAGDNGMMFVRHFFSYFLGKVINNTIHSIWSKSIF